MSLEGQSGGTGHEVQGGGEEKRVKARGRRKGHGVGMWMKKRENAKHRAWGGARWGVCGRGKRVGVGALGRTTGSGI